MTREEARRYIKRKLCGNCGIYLGGGSCSNDCSVIEAIKALEPCEDAISRQAVLAAMRKNHRSRGRDIDGDYIEGNYKESLYDDIISLPSVNPQSKTGHWIEHPNQWGDNWQYSRYECSCCHDLTRFDNDFCPSCGAKMIEPQESEEGIKQ